LESVKQKYGKVDQHTSTMIDASVEEQVRRYDYINKVKAYSKMFGYKPASKVKAA